MEIPSRLPAHSTTSARSRKSPIPQLRSLRNALVAPGGQIALAVTEGLTNVMRHGYCGATDRPIDVVIRAPRGACVIEIRDHGAFVDPDCMRSRSLDEVRPGGLGVHLMKATMDDVAWMPNEHGGTTLRLEKRTPPPAAAEEGV